MKLPHWLVILMMTTSVLLPLAAAGWWWGTWPERTMENLTSLIAQGKLDEANSLLAPNNPTGKIIKVGGTFTKFDFDESLIRMEKPSTSDMIMGRRTYKLWWLGTVLKV